MEKQEDSLCIACGNYVIECCLNCNCCVSCCNESCQREFQIPTIAKMMNDEFAAQFNSMSTVVYQDNKKKGFWEGESNKAEQIALMHSELSEALEADRKHIDIDSHCPEFSGLEVELADTVIRILDFAGGHKLNVGKALVAKLAYNRSRPFKHGKKY